MQIISKNPLIILALLAVFGTVSSCSVNSGVSAKPESVLSVASSETDPEIRTALSLIEKMPDSTSGYNQLAVVYIQRARRTGDFGLYSQAETAINRALEISPTDQSSRKLSASLSLTYHRFAEALKKGNALLKEFPNDAFVYGILADANVELGNYDEAVESAQKMVDLKPNTASYARVAHLRSLYGDHAGAIEMFTLAAKTTDPKDAEGQSWCLVQLGDEHYKYGDFEKAEKIYDEALTILPEFYLAVAAKGKVRAAQNDFGLAEKLLSDVLNRIPNVDSAILLGDIYTRNGDLEKAKSQYDLAEIMERKIGVNTDQKRLALMWADQNVRLADALEIATREQAERKDIFTEDTFAWTLYRSGRLDEAKASITRALRINANDARILYHAGMIEKSLGNRTAAIEHLKSSLKLNPAFDLIQSEIAKSALVELR